MILDETFRDIIKGFFDHGIIQVNMQVPFVLASGKTSPVYLDHRRIFSVPDLRRKVLVRWAHLLNAEHRLSSEPKLVFAGTATAGIAPAFGLAEHFGAGFVYVRSKPKDHGTGGMVEGILPPGSNVVIVDDMVTTGGSLLKAVTALQEKGAQVRLATSVSRHELKQTEQNFAKSHVSLVSLFKTTDIFDTAYRMDILDSKALRAIMAWLHEQE
jgi:orotate phosphoribosyltransferase